MAVAADVRDGTVRAAAWLEDTGTSGSAFVRRLAEHGVRDFLVTAIERDGTGEGPDTELLASCAGRCRACCWPPEGSALPPMWRPRRRQARMGS